MPPEKRQRPGQGAPHRASWPGGLTDDKNVASESDEIHSTSSGTSADHEPQADHALEGEVRVPGESGEVVLRYQHDLGKSKTKITASFPDGSAFVDRFDLASSAGRQRFTKAIVQRCPGVDEPGLTQALDQIAVTLARALQDFGTGRDNGDGRDNGSQDSSDAARLVTLVVDQPGIELFHTNGRHDGDAYASLTIKGRRETWAVRSQAFKFWLVGAFRRHFGAVPSATAITTALQAIAAEAIYEGPEHPVHLRMAEQGGAIWLDLCDDERRAVRVTARGWEVVPGDKVDVRFIRRRGMQPLLVPRRGGSVELLRQCLNVRDKVTWILLVAVLVAFLRPSGPYPILIVTGEQGTAKSFLCRIVRRLIDPSKVPLRRPPREDRDLMIAASNAYIVAYDNISKLANGLSDSLCSLATRGGFGARELYADDEEKLFDVMRPVMLNGIGDVATRSDLLDRSVVLRLERIPENERLDEASLEPRFVAVHAQVLGALLDAVAVAMKELPNVRLATKPRMADFAVWVTAAETGLGWTPGTFMRAFASSQAEADAIAIECSTLGTLIASFMEGKESWEGTLSVLRRTLEQGFSADRTQRQEDWPKSVNAMGTALRAIAPNLRRIGIDVSFHRKPGGTRERQVRLVRIQGGPSPSPSSQPSREACDGTAGSLGVSFDGDNSAAARDNDASQRDKATKSRRPGASSSSAPPSRGRDERDKRDEAVRSSATAASMNDDSDCWDETPDGTEPSAVYGEPHEPAEVSGSAGLVLGTSVSETPGNPPEIPPTPGFLRKPCKCGCDYWWRTSNPDEGAHCFKCEPPRHLTQVSIWLRSAPCKETSDG
jgi:hypothetical protein